MYKKLIIIVSREFSKKEFIKNSLNDFVKKNIKIEIWILKKILNPSIGINKELLVSDKNINFKIIDNLGDLRTNLYQEKKSTLFDLRLKLNIKTKKFFFVFFDFNFDYMTIASFITSEINFGYKFFLKFKNLIIKIFFLLNHVKIKPAKYVFLLGEKSDTKFNCLINSKSILIKGHHSDYDRFLEREKDVFQSQKRYFVFLDQNIPFHQDLVEMNKDDVDEKNYYSSIYKFLEFTKKKYNMDYLISPHPRSDTGKLKKFFGNQISQFNTLETIRQCEFVLCHDSTAVNFAILFNKPIVSIYDKELVSSKHNHLKEIKRFCKRTNVSLLNIHKDQIKETDLVISEAHYKNFIKKYIKCHNEDKKRVDILKEKINFYE